MSAGWPRSLRSSLGGDHFLSLGRWTCPGCAFILTINSLLGLVPSHPLVSPLSFYGSFHSLSPLLCTSSAPQAHLPLTDLPSPSTCAILLAPLIQCKVYLSPPPALLLQCLPLSFSSSFALHLFPTLHSPLWEGGLDIASTSAAYPASSWAQSAHPCSY